ncbi:NAD-dependent epimerase/dehydratase family protein [Pseudalkalibacillus berkeleyi]|uniref:GDP-mannose 4,6-dehydratase n=1 Tax=Pseudalkalibacillus berkeleyi TaxID=1069813 RepID=A0ABS9GYV7_9BACL|nr:NAD-dependent epimerase/dehydratase family protein [Pseudalkalibacillus berkeleyi]MCF6136875.1 GDP-mannose 4,6-dehydratase [Pseudalkalibacillus berkeleyi]
MITGGCGFIGSHLTEYFIKMNYSVIVIDNLRSGNFKIKAPNVKYYEIDYRSKKVDQVFKLEAPDYVIHLAAQIDVKSSNDDPLYDANMNIIGTINLLQLCKIHNVKRFVFASTSAVYGNQGQGPVNETAKLQPISFYGVSKLSSELYIQQFSHQFSLPYTIFRYSNVYGPRQRSDNEGGVIPIFVKNLNKGIHPIIFGDGSQTRDFIHVHDVAHANYLALQSEENTIMNISSNHSTSITDLYEIISKICDEPVEPIYEIQRSGDILFSQLDNIKAFEKLGWRPQKSLEEGIIEMSKYVKSIGG